MLGSDVMVWLLLEKGPDVNAKDESGSTALHQSAWNGRLVAVQLLIEKGANITAKTPKG